MSNKYYKLILFFVSLIVLEFNGATCTSTTSGGWATSSSWSCGHTPTCGDSVIIQAGHTLTISSQQDLRGCGSNLVLVIYGTLKFNTGNKLRLACNSRVYVFNGGSIVPGGGGGSSNELEICGNTVWQASDGTYTGPGCFPATLTTCGTVLPIELVTFELEHCNAESVCLKWQTASEQNNSHFEIERSFDGLDFTELSKIWSKALYGNSKTALYYHYSDFKINYSTVYYRLKQVDFDGRYSYSKIIAATIHNENNIQLNLWPNPNNGAFYYTLTGLTNNLPTEIVIKEMNGKELYRTSLTNASSIFKGEIELGTEIETGLYLVEFYKGDDVVRSKILIQRNR